MIHEQYEYVNIFIIHIEYTANKNRQTLSQPKPWSNYSGVLNLHYGYFTSQTSIRYNSVFSSASRQIQAIQSQKRG